MITATSPCSGFFLFCDIRGFSKWMAENQLDATDLLEPFYASAYRHFGERKEQKYRRRVAKLLGDGFLVVHEYKRNDAGMFSATLSNLLAAIVTFRIDFHSQLVQSTIPGKSRLKCAFGLSFGSGVRLTIPGFPLDYVSHKINLAARLVGIADENELVFDIDLWDEIDSDDLINMRRETRKPKKMNEIEVGVADVDLQDPP